jgi:hypothetical protein
MQWDIHHTLGYCYRGNAGIKLSMAGFARWFYKLDKYRNRCRFVYYCFVNTDHLLPCEDILNRLGM